MRTNLMMEFFETVHSVSSVASTIVMGSSNSKVDNESIIMMNNRYYGDDNKNIETDIMVPDSRDQVFIVRQRPKRNSQSKRCLVLYTFSAKREKEIASLIWRNNRDEMTLRDPSGKVIGLMKLSQSNCVLFKYWEILRDQPLYEGQIPLHRTSSGPLYPWAQVKNKSGFFSYSPKFSLKLLYNKEMKMDEKEHRRQQQQEQQHQQDSLHHQQQRPRLLFRGNSTRVSNCDDDSTISSFAPPAPSRKFVTTNFTPLLKTQTGTNALVKGFQLQVDGVDCVRFMSEKSHVKIYLEDDKIDPCLMLCYLVAMEEMEDNQM